MVIVFDLDDTICETDKYSKEYIAKFIEKHNLPYKMKADDKPCRFAEGWFDWEVYEAWNWYKKHGDEMMLNFPCKPHAVEVINKLHDMGHKIIISTARALDWHSSPETTTLLWLAKSEIKFDGIYIGRKDKENICEELQADIFVDDDLDICKKVANKNHKRKALLFTSDYNKDMALPRKVSRIDSFDELYELITEMTKPVEIIKVNNNEKPREK